MIVFTDTKSRSNKKQTNSHVYAKYNPPSFKTKAVAVQPFRRDDHRKIPSVSEGIASTSKNNPIMYSGDKLLGISIIHKSCLAPIFSQEEAIDAANMRR